MAHNTPHRILTLTAAAVALALSAGAQAAPDFAPAKTLTTGDNPTAMATGYLNNDAILDLVTANFTAGSVSILLGKAGNLGQFDPPVNREVGTGPNGTSGIGADRKPFGVAIGNLVGNDMIPDIAVAVSGNDDIAILKGNGDGTFAATPLHYSTGNDPRSIALGDVDGDGDLDIITGNMNVDGTGTDGVTVRLNQLIEGTPNQFIQVPGPGGSPFTSVGNQPFGVTFADATGDGISDIVLTNFNANTVQILPGDGTGKFDDGAGQITVTVGSTTTTKPYTVAVVELNGDAFPDLVVTNADTNVANNSVSVLLADGVGGFTKTDTTVGTSPRGLAIADVGGTSDLDLIIANRDSNNVMVLEGNGSGAFPAVSGTFAAGTAPVPLLSADFGGDSIVDVAVANAGVGSLSAAVLINDNPPVAGNDPFDVINGTTNVALDVLANDSDPDGDTLTITAAGPGDKGGTINFSSGTNIIYTPTVVNTTETFTYTVEDQFGYGVTATVTITLAPNQAPSFSSAAVTAATQDAVYTYNIATADPDTGDTRVITAPTTPAWLTAFTDNGNGTATLSGTPTNADVGAHSVNLVVTDAGGLFASQPFTITVANVNDAPSFTSTAVTAATEDITYTYSITSTDPDVGDTLAITATTLPGWLTLTSTGSGTASLSGTPTNAEVGNHAVVLVVTDSGTGNLIDTQSFTVAVANVNDPPIAVGSIAAQSGTEGAAFGPLNVSGNFTDPDLDILAYSISGLPTGTGLNINAATAVISGTPTDVDAQASPISVTVSATDGSIPATQPFTLTVTDINVAPSFTSTAVTAATEDIAYTYSITSSDTDTTDTHAITATTLPGWLTLTDNGDGTATLSGTPTNAEVGNHPVDLVITDSGAGNLTDTQSFTVIVANVNDAPVLTSGGIILFQEATGTVQVNVSDVDVGDTFTYVVSQQAGTVGGTASIDANGLVSYDATGATAGSDSIEITVTDQGGAGISVPVSIPITVNATGETDSNSDGVTDAQATALGLNPNSVNGDTDGDGVSDANEIGDPANATDSDSDGIIDALEPGTTATDASTANDLPLTSGDTVVIDSTGQTLSNVAAGTATGGPANVTFPFGTVSYSTTTTSPGDSITVRLVFSADLPSSNLALYKIDNSGVFSELPTSVWTQIDTRTIDITLTDGDPATDLDGIANSSIDDPLAVGKAVVAQSNSSSSSSSSGGGGGGGCTLNAAGSTAKDPLMPLLLIGALGTLYRRRNRQSDKDA